MRAARLAYHTGIVFAAYTSSYGRAVAKGGRYNDIGEVFGRARPASGFDSDLKTLAKLTARNFPVQSAILAPNSDDPALLNAMEELRKAGDIVIQNLGSDEINASERAELNCSRKLVCENDVWVVVDI